MSNPHSTSTQPNITLVRLDTKITLHSIPHHHLHKLNVSKISVVTDPMKLYMYVIGKHLEQIPTVMATFVQTTFVHIRNISAVTDPILTKLTTQHNLTLNTTVGLDIKMTLQTPPHRPQKLNGPNEHLLTTTRYYVISDNELVHNNNINNNNNNNQNNIM